MKIVINILLGAAIGLLVYVCVRSILGPMEFDAERAVRESAIQARLIDIRKAQIEYKNVHGVHAANFEELGKFLKETKLPFVVKEGVLSDAQLEKGLTEKQAVSIVEKARKTGKYDDVKKWGLEHFSRDTFWVLAKDTLFSKSYNVDSMAIVPVHGIDARFLMDTATIPSASGYTVKVFECGVKYDTYLKDLDRQLLINLKDKAIKMGKYDGLRVGSITEINNNAGNWE
ncbi:MAG: hypothetical protein LBR50_04525 [Tannerella sp.]|jgi:hypothetical protein|nr:hypothetical protein [Tannerella sp.]